ncbi:MAG: hypothetical protein V3T80_07190 [Kiloniellales bacterium]
MKIPAVIVAIAATLLLGAPAAVAQSQQCDQRQKVLGHLAQKYHEMPVAVGVTSSGGLVEVLSTGDGDTWTIILSQPNGMSCLVAAGEGWRTLEVDENTVDPQV